MRQCDGANGESAFWRGIEHMNHGLLEGAARELRDGALGRSDLSPWAMQELIRVCERLGCRDEARLVFESLPPGSSRRAYAFANLERRAGRTKQALRLLRPIAERSHTPLWPAVALLGLFLGLDAASRTEGLDALARAARHFRRTNDLWGLGAVVAHRAQIAAHRGWPRRSLELYERAAELKSQTRVSDNRGVSMALYGAARRHYERGRYPRVVECCKGALQLQTASRDLERHYTLNLLGIAELDLDEPWQALDRFRKARRIATRASAVEGAVAIANMGLAYRALRDIGRALGCYQKAISMLRKERHDRNVAEALGQTVAEAAELLSELGRPGEALATLRSFPARWRRKGSESTRVMTLNAEARALLQLGELGKAEACIERAKTRVARGARRRLLLLAIETRTLDGLVQLAHGRLRSASLRLRKAAQDVERLLERQASAEERMALLASHRAVHDGIVRCFLSGKRIESRQWVTRAWNAVSRLKARELRHALRLGASSLSEQGDQWVDGGGEQRVPVKGMALLEFHIAADESFLFVARNDEVVAVRLPVEGHIVRNIDRLMKPLLDAEREPMAAATHLQRLDYRRAHELWCEVVGDAAGAMLTREVRRLVIVPDGRFHGVPFEMLLREPPSARYLALGATPGFDRFVAGRYDVSYCQSRLLIRTERRRRPRRRRPRRVLLFGYSPPGSSEVIGPAGPVAVGPLPHLDGELTNLGDLLGDVADVTVVTGSAATGSRFLTLAGEYDWVHVGCHAITDRVGAGSGLVVADEESETPRLLGARELAQLRFRSSDSQGELVTLATCSSAGGRLSRREGILGLARAFFVAGADAVLGSLWPVQDGAAQAVMASFYRRLITGADRAESLAAARRELAGGGAIGGLTHPFYWAPFILIDHGIRQAAARPEPSRNRRT